MIDNQEAINRIVQRASGSIFDIIAPGLTPEKVEDEESDNSQTIELDKSSDSSQTIELDLNTRSCKTQSAGEIIDQIKRSIESSQHPSSKREQPVIEGVGSLPESDIREYKSAVKRGAYDSRYDDVSATWLMEQNIEPMEYLLEPLLPKCGLVSLVGSSDSGKSSFLRGLAMAVSAGRWEHIGMQLHTRSQRVIYVSTEDDSRAVANLLHKQNEELRMSRNDLAGLRFIFDTDKLYERLSAMLSEHTYDLVILDAFSDLYQGALNENNKVRGFLQQYHELAQQHSTLIMFLHHTGKRTEALMPSKHNSIGSQGFEAKMRLMIELRTDQQDSSLRHLCVVKGNYLSSEWKKQSLVLQFSENLNFTNTGRREEFYRLRQLEPDEKSIERENKYGQVMDLLAEGKSYREIAEMMGYKSKNSITQIIQRNATDSLFDT